MNEKPLSHFEKVSDYKFGDNSAKFLRHQRTLEC